jgi:phage terminase large subunit GpA-like protein
MQKEEEEEALMTCQRMRCWWRQCPGCGRERRLARDGKVMCQHNRWEPALRVMVPCEGSGQEPIAQDTLGEADPMPVCGGEAGAISPGTGQPPATRRGVA